MWKITERTPSVFVQIGVLLAHATRQHVLRELVKIESGLPRNLATDLPSISELYEAHAKEADKKLASYLRNAPKIKKRIRVIPLKENTF